MVKMTLFRALDERGKLGDRPVEVIVTGADIEEHSATLGL
jgi:hypothetical protein